MLTLRCTAKLLARLKTPPALAPTTPTTRLGDWYANLLFTRPAQLVLCVSERTLLPVLVPARELETLPSRFRRAVCEVLAAIGISDRGVRDEDHAMAEVAVGRTASKRVLGSMNDFAWTAPCPSLTLRFAWQRRRVARLKWAARVGRRLLSSRRNST